MEATTAAAEPTGTQTSENKGHNRSETRAVAVFDAAPAVAGTEWQDLVSAIVMVTRTTYKRDSKTGLWNMAAATSYYLSSRPISASAGADAIRAHWGIENRNHYSRDVAFCEDASRIRHNPGIFARLRMWTKEGYGAFPRADRGAAHVDPVPRMWLETVDKRAQSSLCAFDFVEQAAQLAGGHRLRRSARKPKFQQPAQPALIGVHLQHRQHRLVIEDGGDGDAKAHIPQKHRQRQAGACRLLFQHRAFRGRNIDLNGPCFVTPGGWRIFLHGHNIGSDNVIVHVLSMRRAKRVSPA